MLLKTKWSIGRLKDKYLQAWKNTHLKNHINFTAHFLHSSVPAFNTALQPVLSVFLESSHNSLVPNR